MRKGQEKETEYSNIAICNVKLFIKIGIIQRLQNSEKAIDIKQLTNTK